MANTTKTTIKKSKDKIKAPTTRKVKTRVQKDWRSVELSVEIPQDIEVKCESSKVTVTKGDNSVSRKFKYPGISFKLEENQVIIGTEKFSKTLKTMMGTYRAHIKNMILGVDEGFEYNLKVVYSKFPMTVEKKEDVLYVKNLLGEKVPRTVKIPQGVKVDVKGEDITVAGIDKELCGKVAASIEQSTRITHMDRRVIQDGIYITHKPHRAYI